MHLALLLAALSARQVLGYLDPGSGSYMFQLLIGGLVGTAFAVKMYWQNLKSFFASRLPRRRQSTE
ncbi:MAG: hypothetical protein CL878_00810 [Dehalococcoidia bacterium]|nr:hypothetical protein [Dehalococcoidia bacterium]